MKILYPLALFALTLAACAAAPTTGAPGAARLANLGPAPELAGDVWLNTSAPLRLKDLRGKVVLIDFWTFG